MRLSETSALTDKSPESLTKPLPDISADTDITSLPETPWVKDKGSENDSSPLTENPVLPVARSVMFRVPLSTKTVDLDHQYDSETSLVNELASEIVKNRLSDTSALSEPPILTDNCPETFIMSLSDLSEDPDILALPDTPSVNDIT
jgi:hypothetical protein